jgi:hypothetical protein
VVGGPLAGGVLPGEQVVLELPVPVLAIVPHRLGEIPDAAAYLRIQFWARRRRRNRHPGTVQVPAVGEADVMVLDALLGRQSASHSSSGM